MKYLIGIACTILLTITILTLVFIVKGRTSHERQVLHESVGDTIISSEQVYNMIQLVTNDHDTILIDNVNQFSSNALDGFILAPPVVGSVMILEDKDNNRILIPSMEVVSVNGVVYL